MLWDVTFNQRLTILLAEGADNRLFHVEFDGLAIVEIFQSYVKWYHIVTLPSSRGSRLEVKSKHVRTKELSEDTSLGCLVAATFGVSIVFGRGLRHAGMTIGSLMPVPFSKYSLVTSSGRILAKLSGKKVMVPSLIGLM